MPAAEVDPLTAPSPGVPGDVAGVAASEAVLAVAHAEAALESAVPHEGAEPERADAGGAGPGEGELEPPVRPAEAAAAEPAAEPGEPGTEPAPAGAPDDVAAWQARVEARAAAIATPRIPEPTTYAAPIRTAGGASAQALERRAAQVPLEAKKVLEARPLEPLPEVPEMPSPDPVPRTTQRLEELAVRSLPDQKLPALVTTPHGFRPTVGGPPLNTKAPPAPPPAPRVKGGRRSASSAEDVNAAVATGPAPLAPGQGQTVTGSERPQTPTIAAPHRADIAKVLARVYLEADAMGAEVLREARATAYPIDLTGDRLADLGKEREPDEALAFRHEVGRVAEAASIGKAALDAAVTERAAELEKQGSAGATAVATAAQEETAKASAAGQKAQSVIAASAHAWEAHFDDLAARARGGVDPKAVRAEQERISADLRSFASTHIAAWAGMLKIRQRDLDRAREDQLVAYHDAVLADQGELLQQSVTEITDPALVQWLKDRRGEVDKAVLALKADVGATVAGWTTQMQTGRDDGIEVVKKWADDRIGRERGWFERLVSRFLEQLEVKQEDNRAFAQAQTDETVAALGGTLQIINDLKMKGSEGLDRDSREALARMTAEEQGLFKAYFEEGAAKGDNVLLLSRMLTIRLRRQRKPEAVKYFRSKVLDLDNVQYWPELAGIGAAQNPSFNVEWTSDQLWAAFEHTWGTDEAKAIAAFKGGVLTPEQAKAVRGYYKQDHDEDLDARIDSELSGTDLQRVSFALDGRAAEAAAAALREAVEQWGTDEALINNTLRHKTEAERRAIIEAYKGLYGEDLKVRLDSELSGEDKAITDAHWVGNTERADAIEIKVARDGFWGPDHEAVEKVYSRVRDEVTKDGDARGWTSAQIEAEVQRRSGKMATEYQDYTKRGLLEDLEKSFTPSVDHIRDPNQREHVRQYWAGRRDVVMGMATGDLVRADAGRIQVERTGVYAKDETVNKVLALQYSRAYENARRDALVAFAQKNKGRKPTKGEMRALEAEAQRTAQAVGKASMSALGTYFSATYTGGRETFRETLADLTSGVDEEKALTLEEQGGFLEDWQVLEYATKGDGTDEDEFQRVIKKAKTRAEQEALQTIWQQKTGTTRTIKDLIHEETSGRLEQDLLTDHEYGGDPEDPAIMIKKATAQLDFERRSGGESAFGKSPEYASLERRLNRLKEQAAELERTKDLPETDPRRQWAQAQWEQRTQGFASGIETHRFLVDQRTEIVSQIVSMAVAITVGVILTVATGGVGSVAAAALIAGTAALYGAAAGIVTKMAMKGAAYGADELGTDIALGVVDAVVSAATAGVGGKLLRGAAAAAKAGGAGARGVAVTLGRMAEGTAVKRAAAHAIAEGAEGFIGSLPTAVLGTALNEKTWTEGNPLFNMLAGVGMGVGMGVLASGTIGGLTNLRGPGGGAGAAGVPEPGVVPVTTGRLVDLVPGAADHARLQARYLEVNPGRTKADFQRDLDGLVMLQAKYNPDIQARLEARLRQDIGDLLPAGERSALADYPVEMWDAERFERFTGSKTGQAVVLIKDGRPTVVVKQGADPDELAQEGFHLLQALDPRTRARVARLDESVMSRWSSLDVHEKLALYRQKLDLELDAQRRMVDALEARAASRRAAGAVDDDVAERLARARETLGNLERRAVELDRIGPFQLSLLGLGVLRPPSWLDQPARLFAKAPPAPKGTARGRGKKAAPADDGGPEPAAGRAPRRSKGTAPAERSPQTLDEWVQQQRQRVLDEVEKAWAAFLKVRNRSMTPKEIERTTEQMFRSKARQDAAEARKIRRALERREATEAKYEEQWLARRQLDEAAAAQHRRTLLESAPDGTPRFKDPGMETQYQTYVAGKVRQGLHPRVREDWKVQVDYWAKDHPTARGNRFNAKQRGVYTLDEVAVANPKVARDPKARPLRVDSYDIHPTDPSKNKIISRKATDLDAVDESVFRDYVRELTVKYAPGTVIRSRKRVGGKRLRGTQLQGGLYLELPASNERPELAGLVARYRAIAKEHGVILIFAPE